LKKATRCLFLAVLAAVICFAVSCNISEDNGRPVDPGNTVNNPGGSGDTTGQRPPGYVPTPTIIAEAENTYVGVGDTVLINITLLSDTGSAGTRVSGQSVSVTLTLGEGWTSRSSITTDVNGRGSVRFSGAAEGPVIVTFRYGSSTERNVPIEVTNNPPRNITIHALPAELPADGASRSTITVQVKNDNNNPIVGDVILFSSNAGLITAESVTDADGKATATLTSDRRNTLATVTATLKSDGTRNVRTIILFSGVTITATATPASIKPNSAEVCTVLVNLVDAANNPIVGEKITFENMLGGTTFISRDSVTNTRGQARARISGTDAGTDRITVTAAGASGFADINFTDQNLDIWAVSPNENQKHLYIADTSLSSTFGIRYTHLGARVANADLEIAVTLGSFTDPASINNREHFFTYLVKTGDDGEASFTMKNPSFATYATIYVKAWLPNRTSFVDGTYDVLFLASGVARIELTGSPAVIGLNGRAQITATAFDKNNNRVRGANIAFNLLNGPGGGEYIEKAVVATGENGTASTFFVSGETSSKFQEVRIAASHYDYVYSSTAYINPTDTVKLTIVGPPAHITVQRSTTNIIVGPAIYRLPMVAIVSDINHNPVDGAEVTFSTRVIGYHYYTKKGLYEVDANLLPVYSRDTAILSPRITSECPECLNDPNRPFRPLPRFNDINRNGVPDRGERVEPCYDGPIVMPVAANGCPGGIFADFNGNGRRDMIEEFENHSSFSTQQLDEMYTYPNRWDFDWNQNGVPEPNTAVLVTRTVQTKDGIAVNELVYGQYDAGRVVVTVEVEARGLVSAPSDTYILPIPESLEDGWQFK